MAGSVTTRSTRRNTSKTTKENLLMSDKPISKSDKSVNDLISMDKTYRTRNGREVNIFTVDGRRKFFPVIGEVKRDDENWIYCSWSKDGNECGFVDELDLIEVKPRIKRELWVAIYPENHFLAGEIYASKEDAIRNCGYARIAIVKIEIDCEEGEGL